MSAISNEDLMRALDIERGAVDRLREANATLLEAQDRLVAEMGADVRRLEAVNAELREMLVRLVGYVDDTGLLIADDAAAAAVDRVRRVIAAKEGAWS